MKPQEEAYPSRYEKWITLDDGSEVFLRPIKPTDGPLLIDLFHKLSPTSIYLRFLGLLQRLPENLVYQFTHVDYKKNFALVGIIEEGGDEAIIAVGRYTFDEETNRTELGVVVRDDWQGRGLGKTLIYRVVDIAKANGISHFEALINPENSRIKRIITQSGYPYKIHFNKGAYRIEIEA